MSVTHAWAGAATPTGFRVKAKVTGASQRLAVATNEAMTGATFFGPVAPSSSIATLTATGLANDTQYWWAVEDDGVLEAARGKVRTHGPIGNPYSFTFAAFSCAGASPLYPGGAGALAPTRVSNHPAFAEIAGLDPLFVVDLGDRFYYDLGSGRHSIVGGGSLTNFRRAHDDVMALSSRNTLHRAAPHVYIYDDHDYGPPDGDGTFTDKANSVQVYRERVPSYPLALGAGPIYHEFKVGRVQFVVTDLRYERAANTAPLPRTMLGATQLAWFENILATSTSEVLVWLDSQPSNSGSNGSWNAYDAERDAIHEMTGDHGWHGRMIELGGDEHQLAFDSGVSGRGYPLYTTSGLDSPGAVGVGVTYDLGKRPSTGQRGHYTTTEVLDTGQWIKVTTKGWYSV